MGLAVNDERLARKVGAVMLLLLGIAAVAVVLLDGVHLRSGTTVHVYFEHTGSLQEGADFQIAGRVVGEVKNIRLVTKKMASDPQHPLHPLGGVVADVRIEDRYMWMTMKNGEVFVSSKGIIGIGFLEMGAPAGDAAPTGRLSAGDSLRGVDPPQVDRVLLRSYQNLMVSKMFLEEIAPEGRRLMREAAALSDTIATVEPQPGAFADLADSMAALGSDVEAVRTKWEAGDVELADIDALMTRARTTGAHARRAMTSLEKQIDALQADLDRLQHAVPTQMKAKFDRAIRLTQGSMAKLERIQATVEGMLAMIERGEGNIGGLTRDPEFSDYAKKIGKALKRTPWKIFGTDRGPRYRNMPKGKRTFGGQQ